MPRWFAWTVCCSLVGVACGSDSPTAPTPTPTPTSVSVTFPAAETISIRDRVQLQATVTLSDGTTQTATNTVWRSGNPWVATVSQTGLVRANAAGEARIFADVNPTGSYRLRVFPQFDGTWQGSYPAPQGFLGHLIAREYSQEECRDGEARSGFGGGGGSPEGDRSGRRARPWGTVFGLAQARDGAASAAWRGSRVRVAGAKALFR